MTRCAPRLSLEERYGDHADFVAAVPEAALGLVGQRFLLDEGAQSIRRIAEASGILRDTGSR